MHSHSFADYMRGIRAGDWGAVAEIMLDSARNVASLGAQFALTPDNTILSNQVAELDITKKSTGMVKDATKRGLLHRIADFFNIF